MWCIGSVKAKIVTFLSDSTCYICYVHLFDDKYIIMHDNKYGVIFAMFCPIMHLFDDEYIIMHDNIYQWTVNLVIEILVFATLSKCLLKAVVLAKSDSSEELC